MANPVQIDDLEPRFRPLAAAEQPAAQALLDDAWAELLARVPDLEQRLADGRVTTGLVVRVVSAMVVRVLRNPDGKRQETLSDYSCTIDATQSSGALYVSDYELGLLLGAQLAEPVGHVALSAAYDWRGCR